MELSAQCKIHCFNCGCDYYVYKSEMRKDHIVNCPHCDAKMDEHMWENVINAVYTVDEVNYHFRKYHGERNEDQFSINVENYEVPLEKFRFEK